MTIAHLGSSLGLKDSLLNLPEGMILFPFDRGIYSTPIDIAPTLNKTTSQNYPKKFTKSIGIEDETSNIFGGSKDLSAWTSWSGATVTVSDGYTIRDLGVEKAYRIQTTGGTSNLKYLSTAKSALPSGISYALSIKVKNIGTTPVRVSAQYGKSTDLNPGQYEYVQFLLPNGGNGTTNLQIRFETVNNISDTIDIIASEPQLEEKDHVTSYTPTSRDRGVLRFDIGSLGMKSAGCIACWIYNSDTMVNNRKTGTSVNNQYIIKLGSYKYNSWYDDVMSLWIKSASPRKYGFWTAKTTVAGEYASNYHESLDIVGNYGGVGAWNHFVMQWDTNGLPSGNTKEFYINGVRQSGDTTTNLPNNLLTYILLGQWSDTGDLMPCTFFEQLAIHPSRGFSPETIDNWYQSQTPFCDPVESYLIL